MLVGVDSIFRYLNKLTWPRAETKKKFFLWRYDDERYCFHRRHIHCSRGWRESGPIVDKSLSQSGQDVFKPNQLQIIEFIRISSWFSSS